MHLCEKKCRVKFLGEFFIYLLMISLYLIKCYDHDIFTDSFKVTRMPNNKN